MTAIHTESWMRFDKEEFTTQVNPDIIAGGYEVFVQHYNAIYSEGQTYPVGPGGVQVQTDPVYAARNALRIYHSKTAATLPNGPYIRKRFDAPMTHWVMGFRFRAEFNEVPASGNMVFTVGSSTLARRATTNSALYRPLENWNSFLEFNMRTGEVSSGVTNAYVVLPMAFEREKDYYVEIEVDTVANLCRAWVDDLLILDSAFNASILAAAKAAYDDGFGWAFGGNTNSNTTLGAAIVRDVYVLDMDAVKPNVRLGPSTQVIGERPTDDAQAQFERPGGYTSNAEVAALPVEPAPSVYLTGDQVGQTDLYSVAASDVAAAAAKVHAVGVKTQVANYAASAHNVGLLVKSGTTQDTVDAGALSPASGFLNKTAYFNQNPDTAADWTPSEAAASEFGISVLS